MLPPGYVFVDLVCDNCGPLMSAAIGPKPTSRKDDCNFCEGKNAVAVVELTGEKLEAAIKTRSHSLPFKPRSL